MRYRTILFTAGLIVVLCYALFSAFHFKRVKEFRKNQHSHSFYNLIEGELPHRVVGRYFLLKSGIVKYNNLVQSQLFYGLASKSLAFRNLPWNKRVIEKILLKMDKEDLESNIGDYPLVPSTRFLDSLTDRDFSECPQVMAYLSRNERFKEIVGSFSQLALETRDMDILQLGITSVWWADTSTLTGIFDAFNPPLTQREIEKALPDYELFEEHLNAQYSASLEAKSAIGHWLRNKLNSRKIAMTPDIAQFCVSLLTSNRSFEDLLPAVLNANKSRLPHILSRMEYSIDCRYTLQNGTNARKFIFEYLRNRNPEGALSIVHQSLHCNPIVDFGIEAILAEKDSEIKKGLIVLLVRHNDSRGAERIDESFSGSSPRTVMFESIDSYLNSNAKKEYTRIAGHDYQETGKTFPLALSSQFPEIEIKSWEKFISTYPWFPGTDDAYYRLVSLKVRVGDTIGSLQTAEQYFSSRWPDEDASDLIAAQLKMLFSASPARFDNFPKFRHLFKMAETDPYRELLSEIPLLLGYQQVIIAGALADCKTNDHIFNVQKLRSALRSLKVTEGLALEDRAFAIWKATKKEGWSSADIVDWEPAHVATELNEDGSRAGSVSNTQRINETDILNLAALFRKKLIEWNHLSVQSRRNFAAWLVLIASDHELKYHSAFKMAWNAASDLEMNQVPMEFHLDFCNEKIWKENSDICEQLLGE